MKSVRWFDLRDHLLTCLISSGYRVILCTVEKIQRAPADDVRAIYLVRGGNSKDRDFGRRVLLEGAVGMSDTNLGSRRVSYTEVSSELWILHPQSLEEFDSGSFVNTVFLSAA